LVTELKEDSKIKIGKFGIKKFPKGYYYYIGSALGKSVNLENRISRHKRLNTDKNGKLRWHIDYFLVNPNVSIIDTITINNNRKDECKISKKIEKIADTSISSFGSSDCNCKSHFHYFKQKMDGQI
jgi:endonuclease-3